MLARVLRDNSSFIFNNKFTVNTNRFIDVKFINRIRHFLHDLFDINFHAFDSYSKFLEYWFPSLFEWMWFVNYTNYWMKFLSKINTETQTIPIENVFIVLAISISPKPE